MQPSAITLTQTRPAAVSEHLKGENRPRQGVQSMNIVTGIFVTVADAERARKRLESMIGRDKITLLAPGQPANPAKPVEVTAAEQPGIGKAMGAAVGTAVGISGGTEIGAAAATFIPGVGPVVALGILGGAILGFLGAEAGAAMDRAATDGLPEDEFFVYEDALRRGHSVLIVSPERESTAASIRQLLEQEGAEAVDAAREQWWIGLRSAEHEHYSSGHPASKGGPNFDREEKFYRLGFEAALHSRHRCQEYDQVLAEMQADIEELQRQYPGIDVEGPFRRGFERGRDYYQGLCNKASQ